MGVILKVLLFLWCALIGYTEVCAALVVFKKEGIFPGVITTLMLATPWLLLI